MKSKPEGSKPAYKTEWDFTDLYKSIDDPQLEADVVTLENAFAAFAKKYEKKDSYLKDEKALLAALKDYSQISKMASQGSRPMWYLYNLQSKFNDDKNLSAKAGLYEPRITKASNMVLFFGLKLAKVEKDIQTTFLRSAKLAPYRHFLNQIFITAKHNLSEPEEKIMSLKSRAARTLWIEGTEKLVAAQTVKWEGKDIPVSEASSLIPQLSVKKRRILHDLVMEAYGKAAHFAESEINALYSDKQVDDELRKFEKPYSSTVMSYENDLKSVENLVATVTRHFDASHEFYRVKASMLKEKNLTYADRAANVGTTSRKISFEDGVSIIKKAFGEADQEFADIFDRMLTQGRIDVYPRKGKRGGAYCWHGAEVPTIVFLNYVPSMDAVMTLAHEMGHAIHSELSRPVDPIYGGYSISVAEVASTFFENLAFEEMLKGMTDSEKVIALHDRIQDYVSTAYRQIACFNFELELHTEIRKKGALSAEEIGAIHNKNMSAYLGPVVKMKEPDGNMFVGWGHIRNYFYVYSYAYGILISNALYKKYREDNTFIQKVKEFMRYGGSMTPEEIFKAIGIDTSKPAFFEEGLMNIREEIARLKKLLQHVGKKRK